MPTPPPVLPTTIPFNPTAIFAGQNPEAVLVFGIDLSASDLPPHPVDVNPDGVLVRFGPGTYRGLGSSSVTNQKAVQVGTSATQLVAANETRSSLLIRNTHATDTVWVGYTNAVQPATSAGADKGTPLLPNEWMSWDLTDMYTGAVYAISTTGNPIVTVLEV